MGGWAYQTHLLLDTLSLDDAASLLGGCSRRPHRLVARAVVVAFGHLLSPPIHAGARSSLFALWLAPVGSVVFGWLWLASTSFGKLSDNISGSSIAHVMQRQSLRYMSNTTARKVVR